MWRGGRRLARGVRRRRREWWLRDTTGRRLREVVAAGADNVVVMLSSDLPLDGLEDWRIWWGGNLGDTGEALVAGRVGDVLDDLRRARERLRAEHGWVMDVYLLRRGAPDS